MGQGVSCRGDRHESALFGALRDGDLEAVEAIIVDSTQTQTRAISFGRQKLSALHVAAANGRIEVSHWPFFCFRHFSAFVSWYIHILFFLVCLFVWKISNILMMMCFCELSFFPCFWIALVTRTFSIATTRYTWSSYQIWNIIFFFFMIILIGYALQEFLATLFSILLLFFFFLGVIDIS